MADTMTPEGRSALMSRIRGTLKPELRLQAALAAFGTAFEAQRKDLPGKPDLVFEASRLAVFVHGCFWHCCPEHFRPPKSGRAAGAAGWAGKFRKNVARDRRVRRKLNDLGFRTMVVWEHQLKNDDAARRVAERIRKRL